MRIIVLCGAALTASVALTGMGTARAQGSILALGPAQLSKAEQRLSLSAEQKPNVVAIMQRAAREGEAVFKKHGITGGAGNKPGLFQLIALNNDMKSVTGWARAQVAKILSPVQMREYDKMVAERREAIKNKLLR